MAAFGMCTKCGCICVYDMFMHMSLCMRARVCMHVYVCMVCTFACVHSCGGMYALTKVIVLCGRSSKTPPVQYI